MKHIIRLILVFSICFTGVFLVSLVIRLFQFQITSIPIPILSGRERLAEFIAAALGIFPITIYFSLFLGLSYTQKQGMSIPLSIVCVMMLGMGCSVMVSLGITLIKNIPGESSSGKILSLGESGLIVSQSEVTRILLHHPNDIGPQVIAIPDDPLIYQEIPTSISHKEQEVPHVFGLPSTPLRNDAFYFLSSLLWDFDFAAVQFDTRFKEGFMLFIMYIFSLIFLLSSLRFIMDISSWPLANLFLGLLAFRGVLALERFLNSPETLHFLTSSLGDQFPIIIISPLVFCILGISIILYTFFIHLRRDRRTDENY